MQTQSETDITTGLAGKVATRQDVANTQVHKDTETVLAAFEGLTIGEQPLDESSNLQEITSVKISEDKAETKKTKAKREPSATRVPHVIGVSNTINSINT